jgi:hypothetical protein
MEGTRCSIACAALLAACQGSPAPAPAPAPSATAAVASAPAASASAAPIDQSVAKPLSERGAHALAVDVAHLQGQLPTLATKYNPNPRVVTEEGTFVLVAGDPSAPLDEAAALVHKTVEALWRGSFFHKPEAAVSVWVFGSRATYEQFRREWAPESNPKDYSFYRATDRLLLFCPAGSSMGTLAHEVAHPLALADAPHAPFFVQEGIPALFEVPIFRPDGSITGGSHFRLQTLRDALANKQKAPLVRVDHLFSLTTEDAFDDANWYIHYADAREFFRFLDSRGQLWPWYHRLREDILVDRDGTKALGAVVGPMDKVQADWVAWLQSPEAE